nr:GxxExxY protein [Dyadobacter sandarakinus]
MEYSDVTGRIIGCCIEIHRKLGPGLLESAYEECLAYELSQSGLFFEGRNLYQLITKKLDSSMGIGWIS